MRRSIGLVIAGACIILAVAGCGSKDPAPAAAPTATQLASQPAAVTTASASPSATSACPVSTQVLTDALTASTESRFSKIPTYATLTNPECYMSFAVADAQPKGSAGQASWVLFGFDATKQAWHPLNIGSADYCTGFVPKDIANHFTGCKS